MKNNATSIRLKVTAEESHGISIHTKPIARELDAAPIENNGIPIEKNGTPVRNKGTPIQTNGTPIQTNGTPIRNKDTPIQTNGIPIDTNGTQRETHGILTAISGTLIEITGILMAINDTPIEHDSIPINKSHTSAGTNGAPPDLNGIQMERHASSPKGKAASMEIDDSRTETKGRQIVRHGSPTERNAIVTDISMKPANEKEAAGWCSHAQISKQVIRRLPWGVLPITPPRRDIPFRLTAP